MFKEGDGNVLDGLEDLGCLFNGVHLYRQPSTTGGHFYYTDECGVITRVWDTCLTNDITLLAVLLAEKHRRYLEQISNRKKTVSGYVDSKQAEVIRVSFLNPLPTDKVE